MADPAPARIAGARAARLHRRLRLASRAALALALAVLLVAILRPLPAPDAVETAPPAATPPAPTLASGLDARERRLSSLSSAGNIFAADRQPWPADAPEEETLAEAEPEPAAAAQAPRPAPKDEPPPVEEIQLTERPTAAATQSIEQLALRGVLVSGGRRLAMIQGGIPRQRADVELYREGDIFLKDTWRVMRIDDARDRVILEHLGQGDVLALAMYDSPFAAAPRAASSAATAVAEATEFEARREMLDAGVSSTDVDEVFDMMARLERGEDVEADPQEGDPAGPGAGTPEEPADEPGVKREPQGMPPGMAELLRAMMQDAARSRAANPESEKQEPAEEPDPSDG